MSTRQLPPLYVKLQGDNKHYSKMMDDSIKQAEKLHKILEKITKITGSTLGGGGGNRSGNGMNARAIATVIAGELGRTLRAVFTASAGIIRQAIQTGGRSLGQTITSAFTSVNTALRVSGQVTAQALRTAGQVVSQTIRSTAQSLASIFRSTAQGVSQVLRSAIQGISQILRSAIQTVTQAIRSASQVASQSIRSAGRAASQAIRSAGQVTSQAIRSAGQVIAQAIRSAAGVVPSLARSGATVLSQAIRSAGQFATQALRSGGQIISQAIRTAGQAASQSIRTAGQVARRTSGGGGGGGGGGGFRQDSFGARLTERADIYMHMNALKNLARTANSLLEIGTSFRENSVAIEVFVGSAEKANAVMKDIRDFAIQSPYMFTDLAEEARNMMAYGVSAEQTMDLMKSLGDIAGGNSRRFGLLAYAMSQIVSLGKLQGNELRQLTEQGFNPLKTIADKTGISMQELFEAKEKGLITSKHVIDALRIETSEGGHFAGTMNRMSNELGGLMNRIRETFQTSILLKIYTILEEDLKNLARRTLEYLNRLEEWIEKNPKLVKQIAETAKNAFMLLAAFNALGLAVAVIAWNLNKVSTLFSIFKMLTSPLYSVLTSLVGVFMTLGSVLSSIVTLNVMGLISSIGGLLQIAAAFGAVGMGVALVRDYIKGAGGLSGALRQIQEDLNRLSLFSKGFFANFQENFQILTDWIRKNWKELSQFLGETMNSMLKALLHNIGVLAEAMVKLIVASFHWLKTNLPGIIKEITAAVAEGFGATQERGMAMAATGVNAMGGPQGTLASMAASIPMWIAEQGLERDEYNRQRNEKVLEIARKEGLDTTPRSRGRAEASRILDQMEARGEWSYVPRGRMFMPPGSNVPGAKEGVNLGQEAANIGASVLDRLKSGLEGMGNAADRLKALGIEMPALNLTIPEGKPAELPPGMPVPPAFKDYDFSGLEGGPGAIGRGRGRGVEDLTAFTYESGSYRAKMAEFASRVKAEGAGANPQLSAQLTANNILLKILGALTGGGATPPDANNTISPANLNAVGAP